MPRRIAYEGQRLTVAFAVCRDGSCPAGEFFDALDWQDKAKLTALFRLLADQGDVRNPEKFGKLAEGLYELKSFQIRMPFFYTRDSHAVIMHGFIKKKDKTPKREIDRAQRIREEYETEGKVRPMRKTK